MSDAILRVEKDRHSRYMAAAPRSARRETRLLMTTDAVAGTWTYSLDLAQGLAARGWHVTLAVLGPPPAPDQIGAARAIPNLDLALTGLPLDRVAETPEDVVAAGRGIAALARINRVDIVHLNSPALAAGADFSVPVVGACHGCPASWWKTVRGGPMPADASWRTDLLLAGLIRCDRLVAPTAAFAAETAELYGIPAPEVVHHGRRNPQPAGVDRQPSVVLTSGRLWDAAKNVQALDSAASRLSATVHAAGPTEGPAGEQTMLRSVEHLGRLDEPSMQAWLERAAIFTSPAVYEPFGMRVLEAAQAGCVLVLSDIPTFRELWDGAACFVRPRDPSALAATLGILLDHELVMAERGAAARQRADRYSLDAMVNGMERIYAEALEIQISTRVAMVQ